MTIGEAKPGDLFRFANRACIISDSGLQINSLDDGWSALVSWHSSTEVELIPMPKTPKELIEFIHDYQRYPDTD